MDILTYLESHIQYGIPESIENQVMYHVTHTDIFVKTMIERATRMHVCAIKRE